MSSPSRFRPSPSIMPRMTFLSIESSSSAARAGAGTSSAATPSARPKTTLAPKTFVRRIVLIRNRDMEPSNFRDSCGGSGRFCGAVRSQGVIQQPNNPGNDGHIGEVKNIPIEVPIGRGNVKKDEIGDPTIGQPIDCVAHRPTHNQTEREGRESVFGVRQPDPKQQHGNRLERKQNPLAERPLGLEKPIADTGVARENNIDEWAQPDRAIGGKIEDKQKIEFTGLINRTDDRSYGKSKACLWTGEISFHSNSNIFVMPGLFPPS